MHGAVGYMVATKFSVSSRQGLSFKAFQEPFNDHSLPELGHCCAKMPESFSPLFNFAKYGPLLVKIQGCCPGFVVKKYKI